MSLDDIRTRIEYVDGWSVAVIELNQRMDVLSSCFLNGGLTDTSTIVIIQVDPDYFHDPVADAKKVLKKLKLPSDTVCFMTAAEVYRVFTIERVNHNGYDCLALVTAGLSNQVVAGEEHGEVLTPVGGVHHIVLDVDAGPLGHLLPGLNGVEAACGEIIGGVAGGPAGEDGVVIAEGPVIHVLLQGPAL